MNNLPTELREMLEYYTSKPQSQFVNQEIYSLYKDYFWNKIAWIVMLRDMLDKSELFKKDSLFFAYEVGWINWISTEVKRRIDMFLIRQSNAKLQEFAKTEWHTNSNSDFLEDEIFE